MPNKISRWNRLSRLGLVACLLFVMAATPLVSVRAQMVVTDPAATTVAVTKTIWDKIWAALKVAWDKAGSAAFNSALRNTLNKIAMDSATYVGSGGNGQKPLFVTKGWGEYAKDLGDNFAGTMIESIGTWKGINLCEPSIDVKARIGLGLTQYVAPNKPTCTFSAMASAWKDEAQKLQDMRKEDFLNKMSTMFDPTGNELTASLTLMSGLQTGVNDTKSQTLQQTAATQGWLDVRNIGGALEGVPNQAQAKTQAASQSFTKSLGTYTGSALVDAGNVFLNQLAMTAFNRAMASLAKKTPNSATTDFTALKNGFQNSLTNPQSDPNSSQPNIVAVLNQIIKPKFDVKADYNVLNDLISCPDPSNPGPNNCVIDDKFRQAIEEQKTVIEAINDGYLNKDWNFLADGDFNQAYTLRSMLVLRKFRILPVGWEEAINRIKTNGIVIKVTLMDMVSCYDPADQYNTFSEGFNSLTGGAAAQDWCRGLVDPNWVLKAPLGFCRRSGFGGQILSKDIVKGGTDAAGNKTPDQVSLTRAGDYCADEQSCIKEKGDGTCEAYGYCTEEKRNWNFNVDSCEPIWNTCQTYTGSDNKPVSYLQNTLDNSGCDESNAGCRPYSLLGSYNSASDKITWSAANPRYFNNKVETCSATDEGCTGLIRLRDGYGHNFLPDSESTFEINPPASFVTGYNSAHALKLTAAKVASVAVGPVGFTVADQAYTLSFYAKDCTDGDVFNIGGDVSGSDISGGKTKSLSSGTDWQYYSVSYNFPDGAGTNLIPYIIKSSSCAIDNVKLELGSASTLFSRYGENDLMHEKLLPDYLGSTCYQDVVSDNKNYSLKSGAPAKCTQYARKCNASEAGCELFTAATDGRQTAAQASAGDYCPQQCLGYDTYVQKETNFLASAKANFIPATAKGCQAEVSGCSEFTNLDKLANGGESKEYYVSLRQCIKDNNVGNGPGQGVCGDFYTWEGTETDGYQLKALRLRVSGGANKDPYATEDDTLLCNETIFNLPVTDPQFNPDCIQYYNKDGKISYHLSSRTVTCADNCQPYRLSENNPDKTCLNGGFWDDNQNACIYYAIPNEGLKCTVADNGCREYNGNQGNTTRIVASYNFEPTLQNWSGSGASLSTESTSENGHSLKITANGGASVNVGTTVSQNSSYVLKFTARSSVALNLKIYFSDGINKSYFGLGDNAASGLAIEGKNDWYQYQVNLPALAHITSPGEYLALETTGDIFIDNIVLNEVTDRYYFIKDSWVTPDACYYDTLGDYQGANYNLGCSQYSDRSGKTFNLRQFSHLCQDSSVGCELMLNTRDSAAPETQSWTGGTQQACDPATDNNCVIAPADSFIYAVADSKYACGAADQGCRRVGYPTAFNPSASVQNLYSDAYVRDNPDKYNNILCTREALGCDAWSYTENDKTFSAYFRAPGNQLCEWRSGADGLSNWYQKKLSRCDTNGDGKINVGSESKICSTDADCGNSHCLPDSNDYLCPVSFLKTIGFGGIGNSVKQPDGWVGTCDQAASSCTEYVDPVSVFNPNMITNPTFDLKTAKDDWQAAGTDTFQQVYLEKNKLYILEVKNSDTVTTLSCRGEIKPLLSDNTLGTSTKAGNEYTLALSGAGQLMFDSLQDTDDNGYAMCKVTVTGSISSNQGKEVILRAAIIDYKLRGEMDFAACNGTASLDSGCILFNERRSSAIGLPLAWDAAASYNVAPNCASGNCNSNTIIKVRPGRTCDKWLACASYETQTDGTKQCYGLSECNKLDSSGDCLNFISRPETVRSFDAAADKNASGYADLGYSYFSNMVEDGKGLSDYHNSFEKDKTQTLTFSPSHIDADTGDGITCSAPKAGNVSYPAEGHCYVSLSANTDLVSDGFKVRGVDTKSDESGYFVSFLVNSDSDYSVTINYYQDDLLAKPAGSQVLNGKGDNLAAYDRSTGWRRVIYKFNPPQDAKKASLTVGSAYPLYVDDINVEPVLRVSPDKNKYVAKSCRLYPKEDSLSCQSDNSSVYGDGWSGYCLIADPKNPDVCLQWLPVDGISSLESSYSAAATGFHGYSGGSANPSYCANMSADYTFLEHRQAKIVKSWADYWNRSYGESCDGINLNCYFPSNDSRANNKQNCKLEYTSAGNAEFSADSASHPISTSIDSAKVTSICGSDKYFVLSYFDGNHQDPTGSGDFCFRYYSTVCVPLVEGRVAADDNSTVDWSKRFKHCYSDNCGDNTYNVKFFFNSDGYYPYDSSLALRPKDVESGNCTSVNYDCCTYGEAETTTGCTLATHDTDPNVLDESANPTAVQIYTADKQVHPVADGPTLLACPDSGIIKGGKPWVKRLTSWSGSPLFLQFGVTNPYAHYWLTSYNNDNDPNGVTTPAEPPYGAVAPTNDNIIGYRTSGTNVTGAGHPYGCSGALCDTVGICSNNRSKYCIITPVGSSLDASQCGTGGTCLSVGFPSGGTDLATVYRRLATIFYNSNTNGTYDAFSNEGLADYPGLCTVSTRDCSDPSDDSKCFCYIYPTVSDVKIIGPGAINVAITVTAGRAQFTVPKPGYYTLVYKVDVDPEQSPINRLIVTFGTTINKAAVDPNVFQMTKYFMDGVQDISIRVQDNWGYYDCWGLPSDSADCKF